MTKLGKRMAASVEHYGDRVAFYLADYVSDGKRRMASIDYIEKEGGLYCEPSFSLSMETAQELFEMMWSQGFRSKHDRGGADRLDAARAEHIADLRKAAKLA